MSAAASIVVAAGLDAPGTLFTVTAYAVTLIGWGVTLCLPWYRDAVQFGQFAGLRACAGIAAAGLAAITAVQAADVIGDAMWRVNTWLATQPVLVDTDSVSRAVAITMGMAIACCLGVAALCLIGQVMLVLAWGGVRRPRRRTGAAAAAWLVARLARAYVVGVGAVGPVGRAVGRTVAGAAAYAERAAGGGGGTGGRPGDVAAGPALSAVAVDAMCGSVDYGLGW